MAKGWKTRDEILYNDDLKSFIFEPDGERTTYTIKIADIEKITRK